MDNYRIRWAVISDHSNGRYVGQKRMCLAEKSSKLLWFTLWSHLSNGNWRTTEEQALQDIEEDKRLYAPLPEIKAIN